ncbi:replicative DNA helicase [Actinocrispum wychmicini]|uniref:Replicative DNA helicase n=1 Tax=Actinocrispum wychmicini TaxID=1213861 RepID=A0A4R2K3L9_9PSEU|nr:DnaB-like helicase C-terminal domain-containing protein [Actinocrispum wychmicini]TCO64368.1 replicative DNA helicase [Actinocrispum wychmicini]
MTELNPADEERYLASLLLPITTRTLRDDALTTVAPEDFWDTHIGRLWTEARALRERDEPITKRTLIAATRNPAKGKPADNPAVKRLLDELDGVMPTIGLYPKAVTTVRHHARMRRIVGFADSVRQRAFLAEDYAQAIGMAYELLSKLDEQQTEHADVQAFGDLLDQFITEQQVPAGSRSPVIATPWPEVNEQIAGGLHGGRLYIVGARPGEGKSIAAHQLAENAAATGHPSIVFSVEMGAAEVTGRVVSAGAQVEMRDVSRRDLDPYSWGKVHEYVERARHYALFVVDKSDLSIPYIRTVCRNQKRRTGLDVIVIDYLQLLSTDRSQPREQQVAGISRALKVLSRELDAAVVVPAQLNRETVRRGGKPNLADLRESGGIEADADVVMLLARQVIEDGPRKGEYNGMISIDIAKNRHGKTGHVELPWRAHYSMIGAAPSRHGAA